MGDVAIRNVCDYGQIDLEHAAFVDHARVALYAEDELAVAHFAIYELPVPVLFQSTNGRDWIGDPVSSSMEIHPGK
ncbi:hypothetical protein [Sinorhizobium meliloti]|uniref:hypothetical protein n=1 Tax=Rhizobium meliloti TaxID=382 RepID=UPI0003FDF691|nr:hypothetical protein [Sinorhizobium meliloti]